MQFSISEDGTVTDPAGNVYMHFDDEASTVTFPGYGISVEGSPAPVTQDQLAQLGHRPAVDILTEARKHILSSADNLRTELAAVAKTVPAHDHPELDRAFNNYAAETNSHLDDLTETVTLLGDAISTINSTPRCAFHAGSGTSVPFDVDVAYLDITADTAVSFSGEQLAARITLVIHNPAPHKLTIPATATIGDPVQRGPYTIADYIKAGDVTILNFRGSAGSYT